ncbi:uncharacterized protein LOC142353960 [Convolutriloba macropyga]|uniref:uncharacterized protein LOC142353960 n=1 Tax=Convolutriloba macropyga TaxID=536237 RepID=UPI003F51F66A
MSSWFYGRSTSVTGGVPPAGANNHNNNYSSPSTRGWNDPPDLLALGHSRQSSDGFQNGSNGSLNTSGVGNDASPVAAPVNPFRRQTPNTKPKANLSSSSFSIFDPTKYSQTAIQPPPGVTPSSQGLSPYGNYPTQNGGSTQHLYQSPGVSPMPPNFMNPTNMAQPPPPPSTTGIATSYGPTSSSTGFMSPNVNVASTGGQFSTPPRPPSAGERSMSSYNNGLNNGCTPPPSMSNYLTPNGHLNGNQASNGVMHQSISQPCFSIYERRTVETQMHNNGDQSNVTNLNTTSIGGPSSQSTSQMSNSNGQTNGQVYSSVPTSEAARPEMPTKNTNNNDCLNVLNYIIGNMRPKMAAPDFERLWGSVQGVLLSWNSLDEETKSNCAQFINSLATANIGFAKTSLEKLKAGRSEQTASIVVLFEYLLSVWTDGSSDTQSGDQTTIRSGFESQPVPMFSL